jgi:hypothetical protein
MNYKVTKDGWVEAGYVITNWPYFSIRKKESRENLITVSKYKSCSRLSEGCTILYDADNRQTLFNLRDRVLLTPPSLDISDMIDGWAVVKKDKVARYVVNKLGFTLTNNNLPKDWLTKYLLEPDVFTKICDDIYLEFIDKPINGIVRKSDYAFRGCPNPKL